MIWRGHILAPVAQVEYVHRSLELLLFYKYSIVTMFRQSGIHLEVRGSLNVMQPLSIWFC